MKRIPDTQFIITQEKVMLKLQRASSRIIALLAIVALVGCSEAMSQSKPSKSEVRVVANEAARRVDVFVGDQPFTSYIWPDNVKKPVLNPLRTAQGTIVTRGYPQDPRPGERVDHPHH